jgi:transposase
LLSITNCPRAEAQSICIVLSGAAPFNSGTRPAPHPEIDPDTLCRLVPALERGMIGPGTGVRVYLACGATDMRKGIDGLAAKAQEVLRQDPCSGAVFAFRGRRGDLLKLLTWDGQGFCLYYKVLEKGRFPCPSPADGVARLTAAQLAILWKGIDWRRPACEPGAHLSRSLPTRSKRIHSDELGTHAVGALPRIGDRLDEPFRSVIRIP